MSALRLEMPIEAIVPAIQRVQDALDLFQTCGGDRGRMAHSVRDSNWLYTSGGLMLKLYTAEGIAAPCARAKRAGFLGSRSGALVLGVVQPVTRTPFAVEIADCFQFLDFSSDTSVLATRSAKARHAPSVSFRARRKRSSAPQILSFSGAVPARPLRRETASRNSRS